MEFKVSRKILDQIRARYVLQKPRFKQLEGVLDNIHFICNLDQDLPAYYFSTHMKNPLWSFTLTGPFGIKTPHDLEAFKVLMEILFDNNLPTIEVPEFVAIGAGGAISQFLFAIDRYARAFPGKVKLPKRIKVYDPDKVEWTNLLRLPYQEYTKNPLGKYKVEVLKESLPVLGEILDISTNKLKSFNKKTLYIGAPDLQTRQKLADIGAKFIMIGHHTDEVVFDPTYIDNFDGQDLSFETYGKIHLGFFGYGFAVASIMGLVNFGEKVVVAKDSRKVSDDEWDYETIDNLYVVIGEYEKQMLPTVAYDYNYLMDEN